jgi:lipoprotein signal peptidase
VRAGEQGQAQATHGQATALRHFNAYLRFLGIAAIGLALDLWSKEWAFHTLHQGGRRVLIPHVLEFHTMLNSGALFGIGGGQTALFLFASVCALALVFWMFSQSSPRRWALHIALGGILAGALGNMYDRIMVKLVERPWPRSSGYVYLVKTGEENGRAVLTEYPPHADGRRYRLAGGEVPREVGFVRDFIKIPTTLPDWGWLPERVRGKEAWPWVFNVADMLLVGGVAILALDLLRGRRRRKQGRITVDPSGQTA